MSGSCLRATNSVPILNVHLSNGHDYLSIHPTTEEVIALQECGNCCNAAVSRELEGYS
jgi:hypothetical protein